MRKGKRDVWLSEEQIGDLVWTQFFDPIFSDQPAKKIFREFPVGYGRVDFAAFHEYSVNLYELKITASLDSVVQLAKYKRDMTEHLRLHYWSGPVAPPMFFKFPEVRVCLIARYFDTKIPELCAEFDIGMIRVNVVDKDTVAFDEEYVPYFPNVPHESRTAQELTNFFGAYDGKN